jgi:translation initiation factor 2 alpha subunit (eIF-2alpha)
MLALFAIWLAFQQRRESAQNYENTKNVLPEINKVMEKTELLVSENFQNMLKSITDQQGMMLESLKPRTSQEEKMADLIVRLADEPEKLDRVAETNRQGNECSAGCTTESSRSYDIAPATRCFVTAADR